MPVQSAKFNKVDSSFMNTLKQFEDKSIGLAKKRKEKEDSIKKSAMDKLANGVKKRSIKVNK